MNRVAARATILLVLVIVLAAGSTVFVLEYAANSGDWVMSSGSPHLYTNGKITTGTITDSTGLLLKDLSGDRSYASDAAVRRATLHWVGDRLGNISTPFISYYAKEMLGFDPASGIYTYGEAEGKMQLTLSAEIQQVALEAMGDKVGTVAVYNYKTGQLLCAVTTPNFDPDDVPDIGGDTSGLYSGVYVNRFTQSKYIPGSIFKIVTLAAALETVPGILDMEFGCSGTYTLTGGDVTCESVHGTQTLKQAFCNSCNCAFAQVTELVGAENLQRYVELLGVTEPVEFDGITTAAGNFDIEGAAAQQVAWSGIGQHKDQVNPCAFLTFVGAIAGDGVGAEPYVVEKITVGSKTTYEASTKNTDRVISTTTAQIIREFMQNNVQTKYGAENFPDVTVCAKSGTGEVGGDKKPNAMFAGFIDDERYPLAFFAAIEEGGYGASTTMPILSEVLQACMDHMDTH